tara:strand:- start:399 stop:1145 length:747 start_codon:yes stop_codon:yes gene_type:complete
MSFGYQVLGFGTVAGAPDVLYAATGGTITTDGDYKVHSFTSSGTFEVTQVASNPSSAELDYLIIAGGASGGANSGSGGGAGGRLYLENYTGITSTGDITVTVGAGGAGMSWGVPYGRGNNGADSVFNSITATGGGAGSGNNSSSGYQGGNDGGSGGGGGGEGIDGQGHDGGTGTNGQGGGGAGYAGSGSNGGGGVADSITGSSVTRAEGASSTAYAGGANTGTGGGRKDESNTNGGGSGIVIIRYKFQ